MKTETEVRFEVNGKTDVYVDRVLKQKGIEVCVNEIEVRLVC